MQVYIVYMGSLPDGDPAYSPLAHHLSILHSVVQDGSPENLLVRSYKRSFNGFAARLTHQESEKIANMKEVVSVFPSRMFQRQTTRSWDFMGLTEIASRNSSQLQSDVIVALFDSGVWPESESFKDEGLGPAPKHWKGVCDGGKNFTCNNKLIGARYYTSETARDDIGHGTHTSSTVAGSAVKDVTFYGLANGTARGGVPAARLVAYKVCDPCRDHNILAAYDDAIADGVNIISISLVSDWITSIHQDVVAIGAFHAMKKGILVSQAGGNLGPVCASVTSVAPWILTVAASSIDRLFVDKVVIGNGKTVAGDDWINMFTLNGTSFPLIHGKDAATKNCTEDDARQCEEGCLVDDLVKGKIVVCDNVTGVIGANTAGALGSILFNPFEVNIAVIPTLASAPLKKEEYNVVRSYMNSTRDPQGNILKSEVTKDPAAPTVLFFSSRGPNGILPDLVKPDISAPGYEILAAFPPVLPITDFPDDKRRAKYNIASGTSMACPHAAGVAAYVKAFHPDWSAAAIKSSIMTTAWPMNDTDNDVSNGAFAYGSGHINPVNAINPGLVYDASEEDYIKLLCTIYDEGTVRKISGDNSTCPTAKGFVKDHNYPSMGAQVEVLKPFSINFHRRVKNVGLANSTYKAKIFSDSKVDIKVVPEVLSFDCLNEEKDFDVTVVGSGVRDQSQVSGSLVWSDGIYSVRSPIVVYAYVHS
ncbi:LOW QUALITY PROTEIN: subtilisin-like protease SBT4.4 [Pyrus x bretschneideri]|uniref:LOW QUALITY PROTEIN: subtilisin-like protease SBT4.4 n=1 Tax=Pyrus x bretschneideri TaxID=225117 RepID=UPI002030366F|nr:LOW QUALITY PROTEIN: subtilisin-like protease SBT4.4 [Pyrus x bretschneideri]